MKLKLEKYLSSCSFYDHHGGMPEEMKKLVANVTHTHGGATKTDCFECGAEVHYHLPRMNPEEKKQYVEMVLQTLDDEAKKMIPEWRIEEDLYVMYLCHSCGTWFIDEKWSDIH